VVVSLSLCFLLRRLAMWSVVVVRRCDADVVVSSSSSQLDVGRHTTLSTDDALLLLLLLDLPPPASSLAVVESLFRLPLLSSRRLTLDDLEDAESCDLAAISDSCRLMCADCTADAVVWVSLLTFCGLDVDTAAVSWSVVVELCRPAVTDDDVD